MASYQKRGKTWQYTISHKPKPIRKGGFRTKAEAMAEATSIEADLLKGIVPHLKKEPFDEYFEQWIKDYKTDVAEVTTARYENTLSTIINYFQGKAIQDITKRSYQQFLNEYGLTHSKNTSKKLNTQIRACVKDAIDEGLIHVDFTRQAVTTGTAPKKTEDKHLSFEESKRLLQECHKRLDKSLGYYLILLGLATGLRFGELVGLTRKDFDFKTNEINIDKTWDYKNGKGFGPTKNESSERIIDVNEKTMTVFQDLFKKMPSNIHGLVFYSPHSKHKVLTNEGANKLLRTTLKSLGIDTITLHGLRHTHISILLYKKVSIYYVAERAGHSSIETTSKTYAHVIKEMREEDAKTSVETFEGMAM